MLHLLKENSLLFTNIYTFLMSKKKKKNSKSQFQANYLSQKLFDN